MPLSLRKPPPGASSVTGALDAVGWLLAFALGALNFVYYLAQSAGNLVYSIVFYLVGWAVSTWTWLVGAIRYTKLFFSWAYGIARQLMEQWVLPWLRIFWTIMDKVTSLVETPFLQLMGVLWSQITYTLPTALGKGYSLLQGVKKIRDTTAGIKAPLVSWTSTLAGYVFTLETRVLGAFKKVTDKANEILAWVNHTHHELGVFRERPFYWTLFYMGLGSIGAAIAGAMPANFDELHAEVVATIRLLGITDAVDSFTSAKSQCVPTILPLAQKFREGQPCRPTLAL